MATNVSPEYIKAEGEYRKAGSLKEKLQCLEKMLAAIPKHKGTEKMQQQIKQRMSKTRLMIEKESQKKGSGGANFFQIKKTGDALIVITGTTNGMHRELFEGLTKKNVVGHLLTQRPEIGVVDYGGAIVQMCLLPEMTSDYLERNYGPSCVAIMRQADLIVVSCSHEEEMMITTIIDDILASGVKIFWYVGQDGVKELLWKQLGLIRIFTKQPGKPHEKRPLTLRIGSTVREVALTVHKDFLKSFRYARIFGKSAKFDGQTVGLQHILDDRDIVEIHAK